MQYHFLSCIKFLDLDRTRKNKIRNRCSTWRSSRRYLNNFNPSPDSFENISNRVGYRAMEAGIGRVHQAKRDQYWEAFDARRRLAFSTSPESGLPVLDLAGGLDLGNALQRSPITAREPFRWTTIFFFPFSSPFSFDDCQPRDRRALPENPLLQLRFEKKNMIGVVLLGFEVEGVFCFDRPRVRFEIPAKIHFSTC